jgi:hypothetical protein
VNYNLGTEEVDFAAYFVLKTEHNVASFAVLVTLEWVDWFITNFPTKIDVVTNNPEG